MWTILQILLILVLILLNGFFVASEIALVSLRKTRIEELVKKGKPSAALVHTAVNNLETYISATQLGITIVSIGLGWLGEPAVAKIFEQLFTFLPEKALIITSHTVAILIAFILITYLEVVIGEVVPKTVTLQYAETTALLIIRPLIIFSRIFSPLIWLIQISGKGMLFLLGFSNKIPTKPISEDELTLMLAHSAGTGSIEKEEAQMVEKLFKLDDLPIKRLMIHKSNIIAYPLTATISHAAEKLETHTFSRFPLYKKSLDDIVGFVHIRDIYKLQEEKKEHVTFGHIHLRKIIRVKEATKIDDVLAEMKQKRVHMAVVVDSDNKTCGIVTLENIIESVMGDIKDEFEKVEENAATE